MAFRREDWLDDHVVGVERTQMNINSAFWISLMAIESCLGRETVSAVIAQEQTPNNWHDC